MKLDSSAARRLSTRVVGWGGNKPTSDSTRFDLSPKQRHSKTPAHASSSDRPRNGYSPTEHCCCALGLWDWSTAERPISKRKTKKPSGFECSSSCSMRWMPGTMHFSSTDNPSTGLHCLRSERTLLLFPCFFHDRDTPNGRGVAGVSLARNAGRHGSPALLYCTAFPGYCTAGKKSSSPAK